MGTFVRRILSPLTIFRNKVFLFVFLNGFLFALVVYFYMEDNYEQKLFSALSNQVKTAHPESSDNTDSIIVHSLHLTNNLIYYRHTVFGDKPIDAVKSSLIRPLTFDLMTGSGGCGSYSYILSRLLDEFDIETRFVQMKVNGNFGGHIVLEAKTEKGWKVLDASYNLIFLNEQNEMAGFDEISKNWEYYSKQVPSDYNPEYKYEDRRYTNWSKIPVVLPALKGMLNMAIGEAAADKVSVRTLFLKKFNVLFRVTLAFYLVITLMFFRTYLRQSVEINRFLLSLRFSNKTRRTVIKPTAELA